MGQIQPHSAYRGSSQPPQIPAANVNWGGLEGAVGEHGAQSECDGSGEGWGALLMARSPLQCGAELCSQAVPPPGGGGGGDGKI